MIYKRERKWPAKGELANDVGICKYALVLTG